jgi:hypothetical protein
MLYHISDIVCYIIYDIVCYIISLQDCVCLIAPYPNNANPPETFNIATDFDMSGDALLWFGRLQLLFRCTLCPAGAFHDTRRHTEVSLAFFSTFEPVNLTPGSVMQREGVPMFYDSASSSALPSLYICPVKNVLGRVPLIPCFMEGNTHPTIPHRFGRLGRHVLGGAAADSRQDAGNGSRLYELHPWMWRYGRGHERKVPIVKSMEARAKRLREARVRASVTVKRRKAASAARAAAD